MKSKLLRVLAALFIVSGLVLGGTTLLGIMRSEPEDKTTEGTSDLQEFVTPEIVGEKENTEVSEDSAVKEPDWGSTPEGEDVTTPTPKEDGVSATPEETETESGSSKSPEVDEVYTDTFGVEYSKENPSTGYISTKDGSNFTFKVTDDKVVVTTELIVPSIVDKTMLEDIYGREDTLAVIYDFVNATYKDGKVGEGLIWHEENFPTRLLVFPAEATLAGVKESISEASVTKGSVTFSVANISSTEYNVSAVLTMEIKLK